MSQHPASDAITERKRQDFVEKTLPRPAKRRNVIDSSPPSEPSQPEAPESNEEEVNNFINIQLEDAHETQADDPQFDWRTQAPAPSPIIDDDDVLNDPDELSEVDEEPEIPQAVVLAQNLSRSRPPMRLEDVEIHPRYLGFLHHLCDATGTISMEAHVNNGLAHTIHRARSINLDSDLSANKDLDIYGLALVIHVWQVVYLRAHYGVCPSDSLAVVFGAYFFSAQTIAQGCCDVAQQKLKTAVQHWEKRLNDKNSCGLWRKQNWLRAVDELDSTLPQTRNETADEYIKTFLE